MAKLTSKQKKITGIASASFGSLVVVGLVVLWAVKRVTKKAAKLSEE